MVEERLITQVNLQEYFRDAMNEALAHQSLDTDEETVFYVVNLLAHFVRSEHLFADTGEGLTLPPLVELYACAIEATSVVEQTRFLKRLGDVALLISGIFSDSLNRKLVDVDYYIAMGGGAYGYLADLVKDSLGRQALGSIFNELSGKFAEFVDVLAEVSEKAHLTSSTDIMRLYEIWLRTGSQRAANRLRRLGIEPVEGGLFPH